MSKAPAMPLFCDAYLGDTRHLSAEEHGAYLLILMCLWRNSCRPLPDDDVRMARIVSMPERRWRDKVRPVLAPFFDLSEGWQSRRLLKEWNFVGKNIEQKRAAAVKSHGPNSLRNKDSGSAAAVASHLPPSPTLLSKKERDLPPLSPPLSDLPPPLAPAEPDKTNLKHSGGNNTPSQAEVMDPLVEPYLKTRGSEVARGHRLPDDWHLPVDWADWAKEIGVDQQDILKQADRFKDYWISQPGVKGRKADWKATWRNWIRKFLEDKPNVQRINGKRPSAHDTMLAGFAQAARDREEAADIFGAIRI